MILGCDCAGRSGARPAPALRVHAAGGGGQRLQRGGQRQGGPQADQQDTGRKVIRKSHALMCTRAKFSDDFSQ